MKKWIIRWLIEQIYDALLDALARLARKSSSKVDDALVQLLKANRGDIIRQIKADLA